MELAGRQAAGLDADSFCCRAGAGPVTQHPQNTYEANESLEKGGGRRRGFHLARRSWRRRHVASASSAVARLAAISSSISVLKSAW